ncbi:MAG: hypothetical protein ACJ71F_18790, partial [Nitrososphaeraceae archaeon]
MSSSRSIFTLFSVLVGLLFFGIWSNIQVYAQQSSAVSPSTAATSSPSTTISPEIKARMCDPSNPSLKVVNTTESHICGIPKTVKPPLLSSAIPPILATPLISATTSSSPPQQTKTQPAIASVATPPKQR